MINKVTFFNCTSCIHTVLSIGWCKFYLREDARLFIIIGDIHHQCMDLLAYPLRSLTICLLEYSSKSKFRKEKRSLSNKHLLVFFSLCIHFRTCIKESIITWILYKIFMFSIKVKLTASWTKDNPHPLPLHYPLSTC